jgi:hypothetical protein
MKFFEVRVSRANATAFFFELEIKKRPYDAFCPSSRRLRGWMGSHYMCSALFLRSYLHWRAVIHKLPDFLDLLIGHSDAAISPIAGTMGGPDESVSVWQAVNVNVTACGYSKFSGALFVSNVRIRNVQRAMKLTVCVSAVYHVNTLRRSMIALPRLRPDRLASERDLVSLQHLASVHQFHDSGFLLNDDAIGSRLSMDACQHKQKTQP